MPTHPSEQMAQCGDVLVDGVERLAPAYLVGAVMHIVDAWGRFDSEQRAQVRDEAAEAGAQAAARVARELRALFAQPPAAQRATPLQLVRTLHHEATALLARLGVPEVVRDQYEERALPDDVYGLAPRAITDLGDETLGGALLGWGMGKARALRPPSSGDEGVER